VVTWKADSPRYINRAYFSRAARGEPLRSRPGPQEDRWGYYVWSDRPLWLVVETNDAPRGTRLCVAWRDPNREIAAEQCERLSGRSSQLSFLGPENGTWPAGPYSVDLTVEARGDDAARAPLAEIAYAIGEEIPMTAGPSDPSGAEVPSFPWPPPQPTTQTVLDRALIARGASTLGDVAARLTSALTDIGYSEHSFYGVPGGFALATRLEQIEFDGTPKNEPLRWSAALPPREIFSLGDFLSALFTAPEGHYRVIVFVVTDRPFAASGEAASQSEALAWLRNGLNALPSAIASLPLGDRYDGTALVYQYRKVGQQRDAIANPDGAAPAVRQLERSGILSALGR
jgi:hypothetical protein